jgi:hypothetical protein
MFAPQLLPQIIGAQQGVVPFAPLYLPRQRGYPSEAFCSMALKLISLRCP